MTALPHTMFSGAHNILPGLLVVLHAPGPMIEGRLIARIHVKAAKAGAEAALKYHHLTALPKRFQPSARSIDNHKKRGPYYEKQKRRRYGRQVDLIKTGRSKRKFMMYPKVTHKQTDTDLMWAVIELRFPFGASRTWAKQQVHVRDMVEEIKHWRPEEIERAGKIFGKVYTETLIELLNASPRLKLKAGGAIQSLTSQFGA